MSPLPTYNLPLPRPGADPYPYSRAYIELPGITYGGPDLFDIDYNGATVADCIYTCDTGDPSCTVVLFFESNGLCMPKQGLSSVPALTPGASTFVANTGGCSHCEGWGDCTFVMLCTCVQPVGVLAPKQVCNPHWSACWTGRASRHPPTDFIVLSHPTPHFVPCCPRRPTEPPTCSAATAALWSPRRPKCSQPNTVG